MYPYDLYNLLYRYSVNVYSLSTFKLKYVSLIRNCSSIYHISV